MIESGKIEMNNNQQYVFNNENGDLPYGYLYISYLCGYFDGYSDGYIGLSSTINGVMTDF